MATACNWRGPSLSFDLRTRGDLAEAADVDVLPIGEVLLEHFLAARADLNFFTAV